MQRAAALAALLAAGPAWGRDPFLRLDQVDIQACAAEGYLELSFVELELEGALRRFPAGDYRLVLDERVTALMPLLSRRFAETQLPLSVSLVVQHNLSYAASSAALNAALAGTVGLLPARAKVWLTGYGPGLEDMLAGGSPEQAAALLLTMKPSDVAKSPLLAAAGKGLEHLGPADDHARRLLLLVSDGVDEAPDREAFRALGNLAKARGVPIHPIAYSPKDERGPLLNLGELAKRSGGSFRWAENAQDLAPELAHLAAEINDQQVLRYAIDDQCRRSHLVQIAREELRSAARTVPAMEGQRPRWLVPVLGVAALVAALGAITAAVALRKKHRANR